VESGVADLLKLLVFLEGPQEKVLMLQKLGEQQHLGRKEGITTTTKHGAKALQTPSFLTEKGGQRGGGLLRIQTCAAA